MSKGTLFRHFNILTPTASGVVANLSDSHVSVLGNRIVYVGPSEAQARSCLPEVIDILDGYGKLMMPALANAHGHIAMTLMRNTADDLNLHDWLFNAIFPREERLTGAIVRQGALLGLCEMIRGGTGVCADMYYHSDQVAQTILESGMRANVCCEGKTTNPDTRKSEVKPDQLAKFVRQFEGAGEGRLNVALMVHSVYLYDEHLYPELAAMAKEAAVFIQVHISETTREVDECVAKYGMRPPERLASFGVLDGPVIASHCVHLNDEDRAILARPNLMAVHNPSSNMKLGSGLADVPAMLANGIRVGLGTDGAASNNTLDLFHEMRLASFIAKARHRDAGSLNAADVIRMATSDGYAGMGFAHAGMIEAGFLADLQIIDLGHPALTPLGDPAAAIVYCGAAGFVESVMVDGRFLMYKGDLQTLDEQKIMMDAKEAARLLAGS